MWFLTLLPSHKIGVDGNHGIYSPSCYRSYCVHWRLWTVKGVAVTLRFLGAQSYVDIKHWSSFNWYHHFGSVSDTLPGGARNSGTFIFCGPTCSLTPLLVLLSFSLCVIYFLFLKWGKPPGGNPKFITQSMKRREALQKDNSPILETFLRVEQAIYLCWLDDMAILDLPT